MNTRLLTCLLLFPLLCGCGDSPTDSQPTDASVSDASVQSDTEPSIPPGDPCLNEGTPGATATCLKPTMSEEYYVAEASKYFDTLDIDAPDDSIPNYSEFVARWEWPPWLLLTGFGKEDMVNSGIALKDVDPSTVPTRDCRFFPVQPFARCYVVFEYEGGPCAIYEEFVFNDAGEMTFIEAWSDVDGLRPHTDPNDRWAENTGTVNRLSTRVPGLGKPDGMVELESTWMVEAAANDGDVDTFATFATDWWSYWLDTLAEAPEDFFPIGCGW
jgi:hypothetical protein